MAAALPRRKPAAALQARLYEHAYLAVRHIDNLLDGLSGLVVTGKEGKFLHELRINSLPDEPEQRLRLRRHVNVSVPVRRVVLHGHAPLPVERILDERPGERLQRCIVVGDVLQHGGGHREDNPCGRKSAPRKNVVDQEAMDTAVSIPERMQEDKSVRHGGGMNDGGHVSCAHAVVGHDQSIHQPVQVFGFRTGEMNLLLLQSDRLADIVLVRPVVRVMEARIYDAILQVYQPQLIAEVLAFGQL